jgi:hypothetical protein
VNDITVFDTNEEAVDAWLSEGKSVSEWLSLGHRDRAAYMSNNTQANIDSGWWHLWSDGTIRNAPEDAA